MSWYLEEFMRPFTTIILLLERSLENVRKYMKAKRPENYNAMYNLTTVVRHCHLKSSTHSKITKYFK